MTASIITHHERLYISLSADNVQDAPLPVLSSVGGNSGGVFGGGKCVYYDWSATLPLLQHDAAKCAPTTAGLGVCKKSLVDGLGTYSLLGGGRVQYSLLSSRTPDTVTAGPEFHLNSLESYTLTSLIRP